MQTAKKFLSLFLISALILLPIYADIISRPVSNANENWAVYSYLNIDEVKFNPQAGDGSTINADKDDDNARQAYNMDTSGLSGNNVVKVIVHSYGYDVDNPPALDIDIKIGSVTESTQILSLSSSSNWSTHTFTGNWPVSDATTTFEVGYTTGNMGGDDEVHVDTTYAEVFQTGIYMDGGSYLGGNFPVQ